MPHGPRSKWREVDSLTVINSNAAGMDIGLEEIWAWVPADRAAQPVRQFGTYTPDLLAVADWLKACGVETVAMESTGVYWIPLYEVLEARGVEVYLVNARHPKHLPGVRGCVRCALTALAHLGLLNDSFRPAGEMCAVRAYRRSRAF